MLHLKKKIAAGAATSILLLNAVSGFAFAGTTLQITGNGEASTNTINVTSSNNTDVVQSNNAQVTNVVTSSASTGENSANGNTGGSVTVTSGNATSDVSVSTQANANHADVANCNCTGNTNVTISGNGEKSTNDANLTQNSEVGVFQENNAGIENVVSSNASTGDNHANSNTGGSVTIHSGNATADATVRNAANANTAIVGGGAGGGSSTNLLITGNGEASHNSIDLTHESSVELVQANTAEFLNVVNASADTGENDADSNTGGSVTITSGKAHSTVDVRNAANFNAADVLDCGCATDVTAKIGRNGEDSENELNATLDNSLEVFQGGEEGNLALFSNVVSSDLSTGDNHTNGNGGEGDDPSVRSGSANGETTVSNQSNVNTFGPGAVVPTPTWTWNMGSFSFNFSLSM